MNIPHADVHVFDKGKGTRQWKTTGQRAAKINGPQSEP